MSEEVPQVVSGLPARPLTLEEAEAVCESERIEVAMSWGSETRVTGLVLQVGGVSYLLVYREGEWRAWEPEDEELDEMLREMR